MTTTTAPTAWTTRLQWLTSIVSVMTTAGTAVVLGFITTDVLTAEFPEMTAAEINDGLLRFRVVGLVFLFANMVGIYALTGRRWIFYFVLILDIVQGFGFLTFNPSEKGVRDFAMIGSIVTDGGGGLLAIILLAFLIRYRNAWAHGPKTNRPTDAERHPIVG